MGWWGEGYLISIGHSPIVVKNRLLSTRSNFVAMAKKRAITVQDNRISVINHNNEDYISLTDMVRAKKGDFFVRALVKEQECD